MVAFVVLTWSKHPCLLMTKSKQDPCPPVRAKSLGRQRHGKRSLRQRSISYGSPKPAMPK